MNLFKNKTKDVSNIIKKIERKTGCKAVKYQVIKKDFNDTSLGLSQSGEFDAQMITPGYVIDINLEDNSGTKHKKAYHSDLEGTILKEKH